MRLDRGPKMGRNPDSATGPSGDLFHHIGPKAFPTRRVVRCRRCRPSSERSWVAGLKGGVPPILRPGGFAVRSGISGAWGPPRSATCTGGAGTRTGRRLFCRRPPHHDINAKYGMACVAHSFIRSPAWSPHPGPPALSTPWGLRWRDSTAPWWPQTEGRRAKVPNKIGKTVPGPRAASPGALGYRADFASGPLRI